MTRRPKQTRETKEKILKDVPPDKGFHFHTGEGSYTWKYATNLDEFTQLLGQVDLKSVEFHLGRKDFENWIRFLGDRVLPLQLAKLRKKNLTGENLRSEVLSIVKRRLDSLRNLR